MEHLPIFLNLDGRNALIVGGGPVAARKADLLLRSGACVTVVAPELSHGWAGMADRVAHIAARYETAHLDGMDIVIGATGDEAVNATVGRDAQARHIPVNIVDRPELGSFIMPAIIDRAPLTIAVSSGGSAPVLARLLRARIEALIPTAFGNLARLAEKYRRLVKERLPDVDSRRRFWERVFEGSVASRVFAGREAEAETELRRLLDGETAERPGGEVYIVGAGPGDPQLLTFRALQLMQQADVVLHDSLVSEAVLDLARRDAERIPVGKRGWGKHTPQAEINALLVRLAREGRRVCRLKGGDPYVFGRGGEEALALVEAGIPFEVVPGITAANGCAASSGIPLTHRGLARSVSFVTGHVRDDGEIVGIDWPAFARPEQTVVFYMGLGKLPGICANLVAHGRAADTPAAVIENGTRPDQRVVTGTLADIAERTRVAGLGAPALVVVGDVVSLRETLGTAPPTG